MRNPRPQRPLPLTALSCYHLLMSLRLLNTGLGGLTGGRLSACAFSGLRDILLPEAK
jgi:hypothetical protein